MSRVTGAKISEKFPNHITGHQIGAEWSKETNFFGRTARSAASDAEALSRNAQFNVIGPESYFCFLFISTDYHILLPLTIAARFLYVYGSLSSNSG
jgi:hypothetical protein